MSNYKKYQNSYCEGNTVGTFREDLGTKPADFGHCFQSCSAKPSCAAVVVYENVIKVGGTQTYGSTFCDEKSKCKTPLTVESKYTTFMKGKIKTCKNVIILFSSLITNLGILNIG